MNRFQYPVKLAAPVEGGYAVTCRDLPEVITQGEDEQDALIQASDAIDEVFATYMIEGIDFPEPSKARSLSRPNKSGGRS
jgi:antitoxin HicB